MDRPEVKEEVFEDGDLVLFSALSDPLMPSVNVRVGLVVGVWDAAYAKVELKHPLYKILWGGKLCDRFHYELERVCEVRR